MKCKKPFDDEFNRLMVSVVEHLMKDSGFNIIYGYTQSDEISLLFSYDIDTFNRRIGKFSSVLSSMASSVFTFNSNRLVSFDCRISHLPSINNVIEYFNWRMNDAHRNALNGYCYWKLRESMSKRNAAFEISGKTQAEMNEILFQNGINYNDVTTWHKRGTGFFWTKKNKVGVNPLTGEAKFAIRNVLSVAKELPFGEEYGKLILEVINDER